MAASWTGARPDILSGFVENWRSAGDTLERLELLARRLVGGEVTPDPAWLGTRAVLDFIERDLRLRVAACGKAEIDGLLTGLDGRFVAPGPSGAPTRGRPDVLPTGRNFYSVDTAPCRRRPPGSSAGNRRHCCWSAISRIMANWPRSLALSAWGTSNMRTGGDDIAQALALMGVRPVLGRQRPATSSGFEIMPLTILDRPRVDVTLRISGLLPRCLPAADRSVRPARCAPSAPSTSRRLENPIAAADARDRDALEASGMSPEASARRARPSRLRLQARRLWRGAAGADRRARLANHGRSRRAPMLAWGGYAYGAGECRRRGTWRCSSGGWRRSRRVVHNQDNREHDLLDSDDYYQFEGGLAAAVERAQRSPAGDLSQRSFAPRAPAHPHAGGGDRAASCAAASSIPKWIDGVMRHGYKGAFEIVATVDYMFAFAATTGAVEDHHFDAVYEAYLADPDRARLHAGDQSRCGYARWPERLMEAMRPRPLDSRAPTLPMTSRRFEESRMTAGEQ